MTFIIYNSSQESYFAHNDGRLWPWEEDRSMAYEYKDREKANEAALKLNNYLCQDDQLVVMTK